MNQPGYGYGVPQGHHPEPAYPSMPYPAYPQSSQYSNEPTDVTAQRHGDAAQQSYGYHRNMIPGLDLGFSASGTEQQSSWARPRPESWHPLPKPPSAGGQDLHQALATAGGSSKPSAAIASGSALDDESEEGEVSEGEIEDLYEPKEVENGANSTETQSWPHDGAGLVNGDPAFKKRVALMPGRHSHPPTADDGAVWRAAEQPGQASTARERSGSYSPYLSPREINPVDAGHTSPYHDSVSPLNQASPLNSSRQILEPATAESGETVLSPAKTVGTAKKQAQNAILRLWPLNIGYKNYLEEGIDSAILGGLFKDLGLDVGLNIDMSRDLERSAPTRAEQPAPPEGEGTSASTAQSTLPPPADAQSSKVIDNSEERKDRIARLLAAKGSKSAVLTTVVAPTITTATNPATVTPASTTSKIQSEKFEKSKLLHQKMEALRKSREALAQRRSQLPSSSDSDAANPGTEERATPDAAAAGLNTSADLSGFPELSSRLSEPVEETSKPSPSIPGLFLSSAPQPLQISEPMSQGHRPGPNRPDVHTKSSRRPFGQKMESRPFLINVSDDEDDAEMDIDSPGRPSSPANRPETPSQNAAFLRDLPSVSNSILARRALTPTSIATPRNSGHSSGGEDLASMNKKIEAMKRKIAEAEARNKTKRSRQASPSASRSNDSSRDASAEAACSARNFTAPALSMGCSRSPTNDSPAESFSASVVTQERRSRSEKPDCSYEANRRSRSRAASERLPLIEARRQEQLLKLKSLQSQIDKIEQEIEQGMREEAKLKQDLVASDSDQSQSQAIPHTAPSFAERALLTQVVESSALPDAVDSNGGSLITSEESGNVHDDTPAQAYERRNPGTSHFDIYSEQNKRGEIGLDAASHMATAGQAFKAVDAEEVPSARPEKEDAGPAQQTEHDVIMKDADDSTGEELEDGSDDYEPPGATSSAVEDISPSRRQTDPANEQGVLPHSIGHAEKGASATAPMSPQQISAGQAESTPEFGRKAEVLPLTQQRSEHLKSEQARQQYQGSTSDGRRSHYAPYETPLQYFRAYRFHPEYSQSVAGGLRSLTYSNRIDVQKEVCPDELAGQQCPRGGQCEYQHFENMKAPDDQILLQLGAAGNYPNEQKQEYIVGLRQLLTDFRNRKVKDFNTISRGIIDYRTRFYGDKSKILPLGDVTI